MTQEIRQYFAVFIPNPTRNGIENDDNENSTMGVICETLQEADSLVKKYKGNGARFNKFTDLNEAKAYILCGQTSTPKSKSNAPSRFGSPYPLNQSPSSSSLNFEEKSPPFSSLSRSDLNIFRKAIEQGDNSLVAEKVEENPRYLINCNNDSPTILFEGCRYNAVHIAAKSNNLHVCNLVLDLFTNVDYVRRLFPDDSLSTLERRCEMLFDRYLNTPDKGFFETPLHFAAKNGFVDIVKLLISIPLCKKDAKNKYGETPLDLAHSRCADVFAKLPQLELCMEDGAAYVPLYRFADHSHAPILKPPCIGFPSAIHVDDHSSGLPCPSPINSNACLVAYAGPMSAEKAKLFYMEWSSHKAENASATPNLRAFSSKIKRSDLHKGVERFGRRLATDYGVDWSEFWEFLKILCDVRTSEGLRMFEKYLKTKLSNKRKLSTDDLFTKIKACSSPTNGNNLDDKPSYARADRCRTKLIFDEISTVEENELFFDSAEFPDGGQEISLCNEVNGMKFTMNVDESSSVDEDNLDDDDFVTPPETPPTIYIHGEWPTKTDVDVFFALENVSIDSLLYPNVYRWHERVAAYSNEDRNNWPALDSPRIKRNLRRISKD